MYHQHYVRKCTTFVLCFLHIATSGSKIGRQTNFFIFYFFTRSQRHTEGRVGALDITWGKGHVANCTVATPHRPQGKTNIFNDSPSSGHPASPMEISNDRMPALKSLSCITGICFSRRGHQKPALGTPKEKWRQSSKYTKNCTTVTWQKKTQTSLQNWWKDAKSTVEGAAKNSVKYRHHCLAIYLRLLLLPCPLFFFLIIELYK